MGVIRLPESWSDWEICEDGFLGQGSYGQVWKIRRRFGSSWTYCAVKIIQIPQTEEEYRAIHVQTESDEATRGYFREIVDKFTLEIEHMMRFKGLSHIVSIEDYKVTEDQNEFGGATIFIRMELLQDLWSYLEQNGMTEETVVRMGKDICDALIYCEKTHTIHRDIKPQNIFISPLGDFKLGDFGVARTLGEATSASARVGTNTYMAPEVWKSLPADYRSDIYTLGLVMYKFLNKNRDPFVNVNRAIPGSGEIQKAFTKRVIGDPLPPPVNASPEAAEIILRALEYDPDKRYQHASEFLDALNNIGKPKANSSDGSASAPDKQTSTDHNDHNGREREEKEINASNKKQNGGKRGKLIAIITAGILIICCAIIIPLRNRWYQTNRLANEVMATDTADAVLNDGTTSFDGGISYILKLPT